MTEKITWLRAGQFITNLYICITVEFNAGKITIFSVISYKCVNM